MHRYVLAMMAWLARLRKQVQSQADTQTSNNAAN